ncbi:kinase-like domain-containing protein [Mycena galopus ATCC 62051]|nr:kinase-like domain-containing protein [Mycena galopus ATCC 62051]
MAAQQERRSRRYQRSMHHKILASLLTLQQANVLVGADGVPKLADFGISRLVQNAIDEAETTLEAVDDMVESHHTKSSHAEESPESNTHGVGTTRARSTRTRFVGSINWMAPERFRDLPEPTKASDMYAFAYLVYEIFANEEPFHDLGRDARAMEIMHLSISELASEVSAENLPQDLEDLLMSEPAEIPRDLCNIVVGCMRGKPKCRPTAEKVHADMKRICKT